MQHGRATLSVRNLSAYGAGFAAFGGGLHALSTFVLPGADSESFRLAAILFGVLAGAGAFALARFWKPKELEREHQLNRSILANAAHSITLPALCTHWLALSPTIASAVIAPMSSAFIVRMNALLDAIQLLPPPNAYDRFVDTSRPTVAMSTTAYNQRFHATRNPTSSPRPSFAH